MYRTENFEIVAPAKAGTNYSPEDILVLDGRRMARTNRDVDIYERIERIWGQMEDKSGRLASAQYRLGGIREKNGKIMLDIGPTDYREFMGTNVEAGKDPDYMDMLVGRGKARYGDPDAFFSNTLAVCSVIETSDKKIVAGLRSGKVSEYPGCWHTVGGHPNPAKYAKGVPDFFDSMAAEIIAELGIQYSGIKDMKMTGVVKNRRTRKPELLFTARISATFGEIDGMRGSEKDEHLRFFGMDGAEELLHFLSSNQQDFYFPAGCILTDEEKALLTPGKKPEGTSNYFVPPGEASWVMYLNSIGVDVLRELPYLEAK